MNCITPWSYVYRWGDPRPLVEFVERLDRPDFYSLGGGWRIGASRGREMAHALMPHFERQIHRVMERLEYEGRRRDRGPMYFDEMAHPP
jgi:hypothetical protein